jgi:hypothetical protein
MKIEHCRRCNKDWCFRGTGRPLRCGHCKSPYWDREKCLRTRVPLVEEVTRAVEGERAGCGNLGHLGIELPGGIHCVACGKLYPERSPALGQAKVY